MAGASFEIKLDDPEADLTQEIFIFRRFHAFFSPFPLYIPRCLLRTSKRRSVTTSSSWTRARPVRGPFLIAHRCVLRSFEPATGAKTGVAQVFCQVGILFRAFGQNPTDEELAEMLRPIPQSGLDVWGSTKMSFLMVSY